MIAADAEDSQRESARALDGNIACERPALGKDF